MVTAKKSPKAANTSAARSTGTFVPKVLKNVTLPVLRLEEEVPVYVKIVSPMRLSAAKAAEGGKGKKVDMEPATVVEVVNLETGENATMIVNSVLKGNWDEQYPNDDYVDRGFAITKHPKREGKRYNDFSIQEIEV